MTNKVLNKFVHVASGPNCSFEYSKTIHIDILNREGRNGYNCVFLWSHQYVFFIILFVLSPLRGLSEAILLFSINIFLRTKKKPKYNPLGSYNIQTNEQIKNCS